MQPGPIKPLDPAAYDLAVDPAEFAEAAAADLADLDQHDAVLAQQSTALTELAATPVAELLGQNLDDAATELDYQSGDTAVQDFSDITSHLDTGDQQIIDAYNEIPGEAWQPVPDPWTPPGEATQWGGATTQPPYGPPPIGPAPTYVGAVYLHNVTAPRTGDPPTGQIFHIGDQWRITVAGNQGVEVSMYGSQNGSSFGPTVLGTTDANGYFVIQGTMTAAELGDWAEYWLVAGMPANPDILTFSVVR
jgi:hypothetical protein